MTRCADILYFAIPGPWLGHGLDIPYEDRVVRSNIPG